MSLLLFLALLSLTSHLLECHSERSGFVMMYHYTLFLFTKTYLTVLYVAINRWSAIVTLQLTEVIVSGIKHHNYVFNLKFSRFALYYYCEEECRWFWIAMLKKWVLVKLTWLRLLIIMAWWMLYGIFCDWQWTTLKCL